MDSITEQERMNEVLEELKDMCVQCIWDQIEYDVGMSETKFKKYFRNNKDKLSDWLTVTPIWECRMHERYCRGFYNKSNGYEDINENVLYDYALGYSFIPFTKEKYDYKTKQNMWRNVQREKLLILYGKVPNDIINEMLTYM